MTNAQHEESRTYTSIQGLKFVIISFSSLRSGNRAIQEIWLILLHGPMTRQQCECREVDIKSGTDYRNLLVPEPFGSGAACSVQFPGRDASSSTIR